MNHPLVKWTFSHTPLYTPTSDSLAIMNIEYQSIKCQRLPLLVFNVSYENDTKTYFNFDNRRRNYSYEMWGLKSYINRIGLICDRTYTAPA